MTLTTVRGSLCTSAASRSTSTARTLGFCLMTLECCRDPPPLVSEHRVDGGAPSGKDFGVTIYLCEKCGGTASYFKSVKSRIHYACGPHAGPDWKSLTALGGGLHAALKAGADVHKALVGDEDDKGKP